MSSSDEIARLRRKRGSIKKRLTNFHKYIQGRSGESIEINKALLIEIEARLEKIKSLYDEFFVVQDEIDDPDDTETQTFESSYFSAISSAHALIDNIKGVLEQNVNVNTSNNIQNNVASTVNQASTTGVKLPTMELPKFDGKYTGWLEFRDAFDSLINKSDVLSKSQKFFYLKASLEGDVAKIISSMQGTAENYDTAWSLLCERYENKKLLAKNHFRELFELPLIKRESPHHLRAMLDTVTQHLRSLEALGLPVNEWDAIIIHLMTSKLDPVSEREWEMRKFATTFPTLENLKSFLLEKAAILDNINADVQDNKGSKASYDSNKHKRKTFHTSSIACYNCKGDHTIYECKEFMSLSTEDKISKVKELKLCHNCLRPGHMLKQCNSGNCKRCRGKHNTLLHFEKKKEASNHDQASDTGTVTLTNTAYSHQTLLSTAIVKVYNAENNTIDGRTLLDSASQSNFITESLVKRLKLETIPIKMCVSGISNCTTTIKGKCNVKCKSKYNDYFFSIECLVVPEISEYLPQFKFDVSCWRIPPKIELADPSFNIPGTIDILLGAGIFWNLLQVGRITMGFDKPLLQRTRLGWIFAGSIDDISYTANTKCHFSKNADIQEQLAKFWEIEECPTSKPWSEEERACETHFQTNFQRDTTGRFIVSTPFKASTDKLGDSKTGALKRFYSLERKLLTNSQLKGDYYEAFGHMTKVEHDERTPSYFLPHHGVVNESSLTTKLRVVFDASFPSSSGFSLNNLQMVGPTIQSDLLSILLRFRQHNIAISADIEKMYRQVLINTRDRPFQRIVWRPDPSKPIAIYQLNTVTYGTAAASFLAIRCLHQLAIENSRDFASASEVLLSDVYVDDILTGADNPEGAMSLCQDLNSILKQGCFPLRKWASSKPEILEVLTRNDSPENLIIGANEDTKSKILALSPFIDEQDFLRVGGRLKHSDLPFETKHPLLLPAKHHFVELLFRYEHIRLKHAGAQQLLASVRDSFWPIRGRDVAKRTIHQCVRCYRANPTAQIPKMGDLPSTRITPSLPFETTGIDYGGPFLLKTKRGRGAKTTKCYIALFVCFSSKAVHIEIVTDLTTDAFLAALRRFIARRGKPRIIYSDNATNFVGANSALKLFLRQLENGDNAIEQELAHHSISWSFIPPSSPNFGGLWEAAIKRAKFHLLRIMGNAALTYEEFCTLTCQVESILNSRPLCPLSSDPNDLEPLTPSHFLIGRKLTTIPEPSLASIPSGRLNNFQRIQQLQQHFWRRWTREYLKELQPRRKWSSGQNGIQVNSLVLMQDDNKPPIRWTLGRVVQLHPGSDDIVRVATVRTTNGVYKRATSKLYPLPVE